MDWRKHISALSPKIEFNAPAQPEEIHDAETRLGVAFPDALKELWSQSNGLIDQYGCWFIWSCQEIVKENLKMRTFPGFSELFMPFDTLLFFGDDGSGDLFFSRYSTEKSEMSSCSGGTTKRTAGYWSNIILRRSSTGSSLREPAALMPFPFRRFGRPHGTNPP
jgi:hypothetical protein